MYVQYELSNPAMDRRMRQWQNSSPTGNTTVLSALAHAQEKAAGAGVGGQIIAAQQVRRAKLSLGVL